MKAFDGALEVGEVDSMSSSNFPWELHVLHLHTLCATADDRPDDEEAGSAVCIVQHCMCTHTQLQ